MTSTEAKRDFESLLEQVRAGAEVVIADRNATPVLLSPLRDRHSREPSEVLAEDRDSTQRLDKEFSRDLEAAIESHPEPLDSSWE